MGKTISDKSVKVGREVSPAASVDKQVAALQNIATIIESGLTRKEDPSGLIMKIGHAIMAMINENNAQIKAMIVEMGKTVKVDMPRNPESAKLTAHISKRDQHGRIQDFKADVKYFYNGGDR